MKERLDSKENETSFDEMAENLIKNFASEEIAQMEAGNIGILQHDLEARVASAVRKMEDAKGKGDADLFAKHLLFKLDASRFTGSKIEGKSDSIKSKAVEFLNEYIS
ncbi:hypothetical protein M1506_02955 [Patescibacteria group bacterium]|nr:hypothetical protein [Patescibacteria group bacterium]